MSWFKDSLEVMSGKRKSNWAYDNLEYSPILHPPHMLENLYDDASHDQKASIMKHICNHEMQDDDDYKDLANRIWDEYS